MLRVTDARHGRKVAALVQRDPVRAWRTASHVVDWAEGSVGDSIYPVKAKIYASMFRK
jgi:hypothetical protein